MALWNNDSDKMDLAKMLLVVAVIAVTILAMFDDIRTWHQTLNQRAENAESTQAVESTITTVSERQQLDTPYERYITIVELEDGSRCAILSGFKIGSLDCNWKEAP